MRYAAPPTGAAKPFHAVSRGSAHATGVDLFTLVSPVLFLAASAFALCAKNLGFAAARAEVVAGLVRARGHCAAGAAVTIFALALAHRTVDNGLAGEGAAAEVVSCFARAWCYFAVGAAVSILALALARCAVNKGLASASTVTVGCFASARCDLAEVTAVAVVACTAQAVLAGDGGRPATVAIAGSCHAGAWRDLAAVAMVKWDARALALVLGDDGVAVRVAVSRAGFAGTRRNLTEIAAVASGAVDALALTPEDTGGAFVVAEVVVCPASARRDFAERSRVSGVAVFAGARCRVCGELEFADNHRAATTVAQAVVGEASARCDVAKGSTARTCEPVKTFAPAVAGAGDPRDAAAVAKCVPRFATAYGYFTMRAAESRLAVVADALCALDEWVPGIVAVACGGFAVAGRDFALVAAVAFPAPRARAGGPVGCRGAPAVTKCGCREAFARCDVARRAGIPFIARAFALLAVDGRLAVAAARVCAGLARARRDFAAVPGVPCFAALADALRAGNKRGGRGAVVAPAAVFTVARPCLAVLAAPPSVTVLAVALAHHHSDVPVPAAVAGPVLVAARV